MSGCIQRVRSHLREGVLKVVASAGEEKAGPAVSGVVDSEVSAVPWLLVVAAPRRARWLAIERQAGRPYPPGPQLQLAETQGSRLVQMVRQLLWRLPPVGLAVA